MRLQEIRLRAGLTQKQVADVIGCLPSVYSRYETGLREPSIGTLKVLAELFCVSIDELVGYNVPEGNFLSHYEVSLLAAAREADDRAREDALAMLRTHRRNKEKGVPYGDEAI